MEELAQLAVKAALSGNWEEAIKINKKILKNSPSDINTLNRLAYAYQAVNDLVKSKSAYQKTLKLDKYNAIATKNLERLSLWKGKKRQDNTVQKISADATVFLEEPGKTRLVTLINLAPLSTISLLRPSQPVEFSIKRKSVLIVTDNNKYIGALPDDLAFKLMRFLKNNYQYNCFIKSAEKNCVTVFLREIQRGKKLINQPSFPAGANELADKNFAPLEVAQEFKTEDKHVTNPDDDLAEIDSKENPEEKEEEN